MAAQHRTACMNYELNMNSFRSPDLLRPNSFISNLHSPATRSHSNSTYGYIATLPKSSTDHGWIYHPLYGMILFTYNQALQTAKAAKRSQKHSINDSHCNRKQTNDEEKEVPAHHLEIPSNVQAPHLSISLNGATYSPSASPSPSPAPPGPNEDDEGISEINRLYVYQPVEFELANDEHVGSPVCTLDDEEMRHMHDVQIHHASSLQLPTSALCSISDDSNTHPQIATFTDLESIQTEFSPNPLRSHLPPTRPALSLQSQSLDVNQLSVNTKKTSRTQKRSNLRAQLKAAKAVKMQLSPIPNTKLPPRPNKPPPAPPQKKKPESAMHSRCYVHSSDVVARNISSGLYPVRSVPTMQGLALRVSDKQTTGTAANGGTQCTDSPIAKPRYLPPKSLSLSPSTSSALGSASPVLRRAGSRSRQKIAYNVKIVNNVQNGDMALFCFTPRGKHYEKVQVDQSSAAQQAAVDIVGIPESEQKKRKQKQKRKRNEAGDGDEDEEEDDEPLSPYVNYSRQRSAARDAAADQDGLSTKKAKKKKAGYKSMLKLPKLSRRRKGSSSDSLHSLTHRKKHKVPFCPSNSQYYVQYACLLHSEGKSIESMQANKVKKNVTKQLLGNESDAEKQKNVHFLMTNDVETLCDELEEHINRLFNTAGGTIYVGVTAQTADEEEYGGGAARHHKASSFTLAKKKKKIVSSPRASVESHVIYGIKLHSYQRCELREAILDEIVGAFSPQIPHLLNNFDLQFVPVISQIGKIVPRYFVVKITVIAPILDMNGRKIQFRTKEGYAHVRDF